MIDRYVSAELLFQFQNAAIDLAKQLGAAEERLSVRVRPNSIVRCDEHAVLREIALLEKLKIAETALKKLAYLGNGEHPGSSQGNVIAQAALHNIGGIE